MRSLSLQRGSIVWLAATKYNLTCGIIALSFLLPWSLMYWIDRVTRKIPFDYNEGWNAFFAKRLFSGQEVYPGAHDLIINNYPPLSFYLVGFVGKFLDDNIIAGRIVSFVAYISIAILVALLVSREVRNLAPGIFAGLFFGVQMAVFPGGRIGLDDPQMLAHAVMTGSLVIFYLYHERAFGLLVAAILVTVGIFIKQNLLGVPLSLTVWLAIYDRRGLIEWLAFCVISLIVAGSLALHAFGFDFVNGLLTPRQISLFSLIRNFQEWLGIVEIPFALWLGMTLFRFGGRTWNLVSLYIVASLLLVVSFAGGSGIGPNIFYELIIALSIAMGLIIGECGERSWARCSVLASLVLALILHMPSGSYRPLGPIEREARENIAYIAGHKGPAICESLGLCYWAGKDFAYDPFNMRQSFATGRRSEGEILGKIAGHEFTVIQLDSFYPGRDDSRFSSNFMASLLRNYRIDRQSGSMAFFVPGVTGASP